MVAILARIIRIHDLHFDLLPSQTLASRARMTGAEGVVLIMKNKMAGEVTDIVKDTEPDRTTDNAMRRKVNIIANYLNFLHIMI